LINVQDYLKNKGTNKLSREMPMNVSMGRIRPRVHSRAEVIGEMLIKN